MPRTHGANKSILFAQILEPYVVNLSGFAQIKHVFFAHVYKALQQKFRVRAVFKNDQKYA